MLDPPAHDSVRLAPVVLRLRAAGCVFAEEEAAILLDSAGSAQELERMLSERVSGVPLEHVVGWARFMGLRVEVGPGVFVPRPRTAALVGVAARSLTPGDVVLDLCCGSGAVGLALAELVPGIRLVSADLDPRAVEVACRNLAGLDATVVHGDLFDPVPRELRGRVAVISVVAPYVPTNEIDLLPHEARDFEPRIALDGGADGLQLLGRIIADAPPWLAPGGVLVTEVSEEQSERAAALLRESGLSPEVEIDEEAGTTVVSGRAPRG